MTEAGGPFEISFFDSGEDLETPFFSNFFHSRLIPYKGYGKVAMLAESEGFSPMMDDELVVILEESSARFGRFEEVITKLDVNHRDLWDLGVVLWPAPLNLTICRLRHKESNLILESLMEPVYDYAEGLSGSFSTTKKWRNMAEADGPAYGLLLKADERIVKQLRCSLRSVPPEVSAN